MSKTSVINICILTSIGLLWRFLLCMPLATAEVFYAKDEALKLAFPENDRIETLSFVIPPEAKLKAEGMAKTKIESNLFTFYAGYKGQELLGYAAIDTHLVRSMTETFMLVLSPNGIQKKVVILAFNEPTEYIASPRWLDQFSSKPLDEELWPGKGIHGIVGSTLTTNALTSAVRRVLALYKVLIARDS